MVAIQTANSPKIVVAALAQASRRTGADFDYLLKTAQRESGLKTQAKAKTSSAAGLFQFIEQTWLEVARKYGVEAGIGPLSDQISTNAKGRHYVSDPAVKQEILALRHDASLSAFMAGKMTQESKMRLEKAIARPLKDNELYAAHFLGVKGAVSLLKAVDSTPEAAAAGLFPGAARANRRLFYDGAGSPQTVAQLYETLTGAPPGAATETPATQKRSMPSYFPPAARTGRAAALYQPSPGQILDKRAPSATLYQQAARSSLPSLRPELAGIFDARLLLSAPVLDILSALDMKPKGTVAAYQRNE